MQGVHSEIRCHSTSRDATLAKRRSDVGFKVVCASVLFHRRYSVLPTRAILFIDMIAHLAADGPEGPGRPAKRVKAVAEASINQDNLTQPTSVGVRHPLGVRPAGNAYLSSSNLKHAAGLFALWPDELIAAFLEGRSVRELLALGGACKALHAFTRNEEIWRGLFTT